MSGTRYNGWTNYETWCANLWMTNDEADDQYWRDQAKAWRDRCAEHADQKGRSYLYPADREREGLAQQIKDEICDRCETLDEPSLYSDLLQSALDSVDWYEIADDLLNDLGDYGLDDEPDEQTAEPHGFVSS